MIVLGDEPDIMLAKRTRPHDAGVDEVARTKRPNTTTTTTTTTLPLPSPTIPSPAIAARDSHQSPTDEAQPHANEQTQSRLLRLPWELRCQIYTTALTKPSTKPTLLDLTHTNAADAEPALLLTCRRVRREALPLFYAGTDWVVKTRRVNNHRIDPETKKPVLWQIIPWWVEMLHEDKIGLIGRLVVVGTRGSFVDGRGRWREGGRSAYLIRFTGGGRGWVVEEVFDEEEEEEQEDEEKHKLEMSRGRRKGRKLAKGEYGIRLVDLLKARLRAFESTVPGRRWTWSKAKIEQIAAFL